MSQSDPTPIEYVPRRRPVEHTAAEISVSDRVGTCLWLARDRTALLDDVKRLAASNLSKGMAPEDAFRLAIDALWETERGYLMHNDPNFDEPVETD